VAPHDFEADAVNEAEPSSGRDQEGSHSQLVKLARDVFHVKDGDNGLLEGPDGLHPDTALHECDGLHEDVAARHRHGSGLQNVRPCVPRPGMVVVVAIQKSVKCGGVDENSHLSYASAR